MVVLPNLTHARRSFHRPAALSAVVAGALALGYAFFRPRRVVVQGTSMIPTLVPGDKLLVVRMPRLNRGDVVALRDPRDAKRLIVKRVVSEAGGVVVVRGDNESASVDSRDFGPVRKRDVVGSVVRRYGPPGREGIVI
jgi:nickel-type superoxide dismutase maturation protease